MRERISASRALLLLTLLLGLGSLASITPEVLIPEGSASSYGITCDSTYWYVESANLKLIICKSDGLWQYFVGEGNWTSTKGLGGISVTKKGVGFNDGASPPYDMDLTPFPYSATELSLNATHLSYMQAKESGATLRLYVDIEAKADSIECLFKIENLDRVVRGFTLAFSAWIYRNNMKQVFPYKSILEQERATFGFLNSLSGETIAVNYPVGALANASHAVALYQSPYNNAQLKYYGVLDDSSREAFYYGYEALRAMPSANTTEVGVIFFAVEGNCYSALNKLPTILSSCIATTAIPSEFWVIFGTPIMPSLITDSYLRELKDRNIRHIELQFHASSTYTTNRNWTLTNTEIASLLTDLKAEGFNTWFYITTNFEASRTDAKNMYSDSLIKTATQQNVNVDYAVLNPDPAYSWGARIVSDVDYIMTTFGGLITGFFIDDLGYYGNRLDYNADHNPKYYDHNISTRNATSLSFGIANLMAQLATKGCPLVVSAPIHIEEVYYADGALLWDYPIDSGTPLYLRFSTLNWLLPKGFHKTGIASNVGDSHDGPNNIAYNLSFWTNGQIYPFGYNDYKNTVFSDAKTRHHVENAWFLEQPAEYAYGNTTLEIQNSDTKLAIFSQSSIATITSSTPLDIYTKSGTLIAKSTINQSVSAYLDGLLDIFVVKPSQATPYVALSESTKINGETIVGDQFSFTVSSPSSFTSTTIIHCGDKGKPFRIYPSSSDMGYNEVTGLQTISWTHSSDQLIEVIFGSAPPDDYPPIVPSVDEAPPVVTIISPQSKTYAATDLPLRININETVSWIGYSLDSHANVTVLGNATISGLSEGVHQLTVYSSDTSGNMGRSETVGFTIDTVPPHITIFSPENKSYATQSISLNFTVSETVSWIGYSLNGQANVTISGNTTLCGLSEGSHRAAVCAKDVVGNTGGSQVVYFTVHAEATKPIMPLEWGVAAIVIIVVVCGIAGLILPRRKALEQR